MHKKVIPPLHFSGSVKFEYLAFVCLIGVEVDFTVMETLEKLKI